MSYVSIGAVSGVSFADGLSAGRSALVRLGLLGRALQAAATDLAQQGIGDQVVRFATVTGPPKLDEAQARNDLGRLQSMQRATNNIANLAADELKDAVVERFLTLNILPPVLSEYVKEGQREMQLPGAGTEIPLEVKIALGLGAAVAVAYVVRIFR